MAAISQKTIASGNFMKEKFCFFYSNFTGQSGNIGSWNGLAPNRQQIITWTNANPVHCRIYAALEGDKLTIKNDHVKMFNVYDIQYINQSQRL